jgi:DNA-binding winged helix-turn-helix (wHTH) protein
VNLLQAVLQPLRSSWLFPSGETCRPHGWNCRPYSDLPESVDKLTDDPFRSLAGELRSPGGFAKDTTPFSEFIAKPFEPRELLARVKSVLRRTINAAPPSAGPRIRMGCRVLDLEKRVLVDPTNGQQETLTASEFDLLKLFAEHPNKPLQRDWLLEATAHREMEPFDRAIDLRITRLRRKIEFDPAHPNAIRTVRGVGYMFVPPTH